MRPATIRQHIAALEEKLASYRPENYTEERHYKRARCVTENHIKHLRRDLVRAEEREKARGRETPVAATRIMLNLPVSMAEALRERAYRLRVSVAECVRRAVGAWLKREEEGK